jgi:hypothetical protein
VSSNTVGKGLLKAADQELSFRRRIVELIGGLLKSDAPYHFKAFVVILLFIGLSASFIFAMFVLEVLLVVFKGQAHEVHITTYASILSGHCLFGVLTGIPVTMRMGAFEESRRLEGTLGRVQEIRSAKKRAHEPKSSDD